MSIPIEVGYGRVSNTLHLASFKVTGPEELEIHAPVAGTITLSRDAWHRIINHIDESFDEAVDETFREV